MTPEGQVKKDIKDYLARTGWDYFSIHQQGYRATKGIPDMIIFKAGTVVFLEVKSEKGALRPEQAKWSQRILSKGCIYLVARSVEELHEAIQRYVK